MGSREYSNHSDMVRVGTTDIQVLTETLDIQHSKSMACRDGKEKRDEAN